MIGQLIEDGPRYFGKRDGWYWIVPCRGMPTKSCGANCSTKAMMPMSASSPFSAERASSLLSEANWCTRTPRSSEERLEHCLPEILLADDGNPHAGVLSQDLHSRPRARRRGEPKASDWLTAMLARDDGTVKGDQECIGVGEARRGKGRRGPPPMI